MRARNETFPIIGKPASFFLVFLMALVIAACGVPRMGAAAPRRAAPSVEYISEFETPSWPFT